MGSCEKLNKCFKSHDDSFFVFIYIFYSATLLEELRNIIAAAFADTPQPVYDRLDREKEKPRV